MRKGEIACNKQFLLFSQYFLPHMAPLTSAEACEKSSRWLWKEKLSKYWCEKARKDMCVTDRHDMTLAVKVALNPNITNQPTPYGTYFAF